MLPDRMNSPILFESKKQKKPLQNQKQKQTMERWQDDRRPRMKAFYSRIPKDSCGSKKYLHFKSSYKLCELLFSEKSKRNVLHRTKDMPKQHTVFAQGHWMSWILETNKKKLKSMAD